MSLTDEVRQSMCAATREAAQVLVDDVRALRDTFGKENPTNGDVRRASATMRRLLLQDHLQVVAGPRIGRMHFIIPDDTRLIEDAEGQFVTVGLAPMWGWGNRLVHIYRTSAPGEGDNFLNLCAPDEVLAIRTVTIDGLMADRVARLDGKFVTRGEVLKFVLYKGYGAHFTGRDIPAFDLIRRMRYAMVFTRDDDGHLKLDVGNVDREPKPHLIDLTHAHAFATGFYVINSPDMVRLESIIDAEGAT